MKITINKKTGIIKLPEDYNILENLTNNGYFHYVIRYQVNAQRAIKEKALTVKIHVSPKSPDSIGIVGFENQNSEEIIKNLLTRSLEKKEIARAFEQSYILTITSDITSKIPNDKTRELSENKIQLGITNNTKKSGIFQNTKFNLIKASDLNKNNILQSVLQTPISITGLINQSLNNKKSSSEESFNLLFKHNIDPAIIGKKTNQYSDTASVYSGIINLPTGVAKEISNENKTSANNSKISLLSKVIGTQKSKPANQLGLAKDDYVHVLAKESTDFITVEEDIFLPVSEAPEQFYLIFELQDESGVEVEEITGIVHHSRNLSIFTLPTITPFISVSACDGYNSLQIKQLDPNAAGVFLYKREVNGYSANVETDYKQIEKIPLRAQDGIKFFNDKTSGISTVIYRVIAYNRAELKSHDFSSVVLNPPQKSFLLNKKVQKKITFISISLKIINKSIQIELNDIPSGVLNITIFKKDLTTHQSLEEASLVGNSIYLDKLNSKSDRFFITDNNIVEQRIYEYLALLTFLDGTEIWSNSTSVIQYNPIANNIIETRTSPIKTVNLGSELDIQFDITSVASEGKIDQIKKALEQQGIIGFYQNDIAENRDQLQNLIAYHIQRTNITTSEFEDMGVFIGTAFSDKAIGKLKNVKPLVSNQTYEYTIDTHFRTVESLIPTFTKTVTNPLNSNLDYTYSPSKWLHPVTLKEGNLISDSSLKRNHSNTDFTFGIIADIIHTRIVLPDTQPVIFDVTVKGLGSGTIIVQWKGKGSLKKIDHFLIVKEEMGMKTIAGRTHALTETNTYSFIDSVVTPEAIKSTPAKTSGMSDMINVDYLTAVIYHIIPVLNDYSQAPSAKSLQTITKKII